MSRSDPLLIVLAVVALGDVAWAQGDRPQAVCVQEAAMTEEGGGGSPAGRAVAEFEGVYKRRFKNALVDGTKYDAEDILEIVRYGDGTVYFRTHLEFFNGHLCARYGIARYEDGAFLFTEAKPAAGGSPCGLAIKLSKRDVVLADPQHSCRAYCGARGRFHGRAFPYRARRPIRYLERLKSSRQYLEAVREFEGKAR